MAAAMPQQRDIKLWPPLPNSRAVRLGLKISKNPTSRSITSLVENCKILRSIPQVVQNEDLYHTVIYPSNALDMLNPA